MANSKSLGVAYEDQAIVGGTINSTPIGATTPSSGAFTTLTSTGNTALGNAASDTIGLYGATPVIQRATAASHTTIATTVAVSTTSSVATGWGFSTSTQANELTAAMAEVQATLVALGIWAA